MGCGVWELHSPGVASWLRAVNVKLAGVALGFGPCREGCRSSAVPGVLSRGLREGCQSQTGHRHCGVAVAQGTTFAALAAPVPAPSVGDVWG